MYYLHTNEHFVLGCHLRFGSSGELGQRREYGVPLGVRWKKWVRAEG